MMGDEYEENGVWYDSDDGVEVYEWVDPDEEFCPVCDGTGMADDTLPCEHCDGTGYEWWL